MKDFNLHRLMSGTVLPPRADELTMATFLLHLTTLLDGTNPTSRGKDLSAPILQFTSWATWGISCKELLLQSQTGLPAPLYQRRWSCDAFAFVKAGELRLSTSLARGLHLQDSRFGSQCQCLVSYIMNMCSNKTREAFRRSTCHFLVQISESSLSQISFVWVKSE